MPNIIYSILCMEQSLCQCWRIGCRDTTILLLPQYFCYHSCSLKMNISPSLVALDIGFLVDGSKEVTELNYRLEIKFVTTIVQSFVISKEGIHAGFAVISGDGLLISDFGSNTDTSSFVTSVEKAPYPGEDRQGGKGIVVVKDNLFATSGRKQATKVM